MSRPARHAARAAGGNDRPMSRCARQTVDGRRCLNPSERGDCGRHHDATLAVDVVAEPAGGVMVADPFASAAAWRHREAYEAQADTSVGWGDTVVGRAGNEARAWLDRARRACAADPDLLAVLDAERTPERPKRHRMLSEEHMAEAQEQWDAVHGDPEPAWTQVRRLVGDPDGMVHIADACDKVDTVDGIWGACADFADRSFCACVSGFVPRLQGLQSRYRMAQRRIGTAKTAIRISRIDRFDAATAADLIPAVAPKYGRGVGQWRQAVRARAQAMVDPETAGWLLRVGSWLDRSVDLHDHDTTSRLAEALRDAIVQEGVVDPDVLADRAAGAVDGPLTRRSRLRDQAAELIDGAAAWASGTEDAKRKPYTGPRLPGRYARFGAVHGMRKMTLRGTDGIVTRDPRHAMLHVLVEAATADTEPDPNNHYGRTNFPAPVNIAHELANSIASTRHRIGHLWERTHGKRR